MTEIQILAPLDGTVIELEKVPDEVFAQKMAGDGVAIDPSGAVAVAPVTGSLTKLFPGGHAFGMTMDNDVELIVHIGLDTVELKGQGFENIATEGQMVKAGDPIVRYDLATLKRLGKVVLSPVVSCGSGTVVSRATGTVKAGRDVLFVLQLD
ncbi:MAG: PTS glucose transporter subunit IIA [Chloroflexota bacterium]|nr:PTS glucose transporter subunit IIA [Chloroflexota bacterium]